jgi:tetratricopeptide (TPR) repeat protein
MRKSNNFGRAGVKPSCVTLALMLALMLCAHSSLAAQQQRPNIADEVESDKKTQPREADPKPAKETRTPRRTNAPVRRNAPALIPVTVFAGAPGVEIYVERVDGSSYRLGTTRDDGTLALKLPRGTYNLVVARPDSRPVRRQIEVSPGRTAFSLDLARAEAASATEPAAPAQPVVTAEDVFRRFLDPVQSDGVTLADWQAAQAETAESYSHNSEDPQTAAQAHFAFGQVAYLNGDFQTAVNSFNNAALAVPNSALAFYGLGNAYIASRQPAEAARAYQQALKIRPNMALALKGMGDALYSQGKSKESVEYYARAHALGYDSPALKLGMARGLLRERRWQEALDLLNGLSKSRPSSEVFVGLGDAYAGLKQPSTAAGAYRQAVELDSRSAVAQYKLGEISFQLRDYAAAREALERALALDPEGATFDRGRARDLLGKSAAKLGRK